MGLRLKRIMRVSCNRDPERFCKESFVYMEDAESPGQFTKALVVEHIWSRAEKHRESIFQFICRGDIGTCI